MIRLAPCRPQHCTIGWKTRTLHYPIFVLGTPEKSMTKQSWAWRIDTKWALQSAAMNKCYAMVIVMFVREYKEITFLQWNVLLWTAYSMSVWIPQKIVEKCAEIIAKTMLTDTNNSMHLHKILTKSKSAKMHSVPVEQKENHNWCLATGIGSTGKKEKTTTTRATVDSNWRRWIIYKKGDRCEQRLYLRLVGASSFIVKTKTLPTFVDNQWDGLSILFCKPFLIS